MGFFRNPEIRRELLLFVAVTAACAASGFLAFGAAGWLVLGAGLALSALHFAASAVRYRRIRALSRDIDAVLHGSDKVNFSDLREGELAILQSEIQKMTIRLRDAADNLQKEKTFLTDSIADISHQLRTPLTSINLIVTLLAADAVSDARRLELTRELKMLLRRIDWMVESLLKMSKIDAGTALFQAEPVRVSELVRAAAEPLAVPLDVRGQRLVCEIGAETFTGDLAWTTEAVGNILKNCMEHTPEGGTITVQARDTGVFTELTVHDTGAGIAPDDLPHLFERFYKGKDASETSFGIGLALARMIVTAQNGAIKAANAPNGGAVFTIRFYKGTV
ncbi:MAG: HAMP domain-containing histidine kinase [Oscillospiraceae bacterium]|nr:HAMP domain-containing histidine kinase [Oscillospiraceae bacterium]